jgi:hypothetical protein
MSLEIIEENYPIEIDLIKMERELIKESRLEPAEWIKKNSAIFRDIAADIILKHNGNREAAKKEIKEALEAPSETVH